MIRQLVAGALLVASAAVPRSVPAGFRVEEHMVASGGRTYVEAVVYSQAPHDLWISLSTANHGPLWPSVVDARECSHATACHYRYDVSGRTEEGKPICPRASLDVAATQPTWLGMWRAVLMEDSFSVC